MQKRKLGNSGLEVSAMGYGCTLAPVRDATKFGFDVDPATGERRGGGCTACEAITCRRRPTTRSANRSACCCRKRAATPTGRGPKCGIRSAADADATSS